MNHPLLTLFLVFSGLAVVSVGGVVTILPDLQREVVHSLHWMSPIEFAHALTLVQIAPGPNLFIVSLIGWHVAGLLGLLVATFAVVGPTSLIALVSGRLFIRFSSMTWVAALKDAMAPLVVGFSFATVWVIAESVDQNYFYVIITLGVASFVSLTSYNPLWGFLAGLGIALVDQLW